MHIDDIDEFEGQAGHQKYWAEVLMRASELDPEAMAKDVRARQFKPTHKHEYLDISQKPIYVVSVKPVRTFIVTPITAAKFIVGGTHRLADEKEIAAYEQFHSAARAAIANSQSRQSDPMVAALVQALQSRPGGKNSAAA